MGGPAPARGGPPITVRASQPRISGNIILYINTLRQLAGLVFDSRIGLQNREGFRQIQTLAPEAAEPPGGCKAIRHHFSLDTKLNG
jgi:hypothetical protein